MGDTGGRSGNSRSARHVLGRRVRLYQTLRTAHLERALELAPATILFRDRRYDFDEDLASRLTLVTAGPLRLAGLLLRHRIDEFEINEPMMRSSIRGTALALAAVRVRNLLTRHRTRVVTYAIDNLDSFAAPISGLRPQLRRAVDLLLTASVWRSVDRIVYGTPAARAVYRARWPVCRATETVILALPQPCAGCPARKADGHHVVFLGALDDRKGLLLVMAAWPGIRAELDDATLMVIGKGPLEDRVRAWAADRSGVDLIIDPPRSAIHRELNRAAVLVLPSQPQPAWREQIGLPIVEALAHGVPVVTTTETGLADWLSEHGHGVIPAPGTAAELAAAVAGQIAAQRSRRSVLETLPKRDGRLAADDWLFAPS